jgi:hypothetical protein
MVETSGRRAPLSGTWSEAAAARGWLVNTVPKSGTYMVARLLEELGLRNSRLHLVDTGYYDFRDLQLPNMAADGEVPLQPEPTRRALRRVGPGRFAVAHLQFGDEAAALAEQVRLFCIRDIHDALISQMRFVADPRRRGFPSEDWMTLDDPRRRFVGFLQAHGAAFVAYARGFLPWMFQDSVLVCRFEALAGDFGRESQAGLLEAICAQVGAPPPADLVELFETRVRGWATRTYSGERSQRDAYFSDEARSLCARLGTGAVNNGFGYGPAPAGRAAARSRATRATTSSQAPAAR